MHMGHSHSHHHHHDHTDSVANPSVPVDPAAQASKRLRMAASFIFCTIATLGFRVWKSQPIRQADIAAFAISSLVLASADKIRREINYILLKLKNLRDGFVKHSNFAAAESHKNPIDYLFRNKNEADRVTWIGVIVNLVLSAGKFGVGVTCNSQALIADAGHSLSDLFSDFVTLYSVQVARLPPDDDHPYGHGKFEAIGSLFLALTLLGTGVSVGAMANRKLLQILSGKVAAGSVLLPTAPALVMAGLSIASKEWLYRITKRVGDKLNSQVVIANAYHHRSDAYSSVLALLSIGLAMSVPGMVAADSAAGMLVAGMICMTGADILGESIKQLSDTTNEELVVQVEQLVGEQEDVAAVSRVRARQVGSQALVDVQMETPEGLSTSAARTIEERIRRQILQQPGVLDAEVHAKPPSEVVCPLLLEANKDETPSASSVEQNVRQVVLLHPGVESVDVTVHFKDTTRVSVDVDIRVDPNDTIQTVQKNAQDLQDDLEQSPLIDEANLYLTLDKSAASIERAAKLKGREEQKQAEQGTSPSFTNLSP